MKKILITLLAVAFVSALALPALAAFNGQIPENGPHWQVNFIGVPKGKKVDMDDSKRRTVFVPLDAKGEQGPVRINYTWVPGDLTFQVKDGNATDANGATIQVPAVAINPDVSGSGYLSYNVYAVALGKPMKGEPAVITAHCTYTEDVITDDGVNTCDASLLMGSFEIKRTAGKPKVVDISNIFRASGCFDVGGEEGICDTGDYQFSNMWIFNIPFLESYYWDYDANGLKLMQVRFYQTTSGEWNVVQ
jgi:hypothetical protein